MICENNILNIFPIQDTNEKSCIDYIIESIADWRKCDYRLMYIDSWRFRFIPVRVQREGIWSRGEVASYLYFGDELNTYTNLKELVGINIVWRNNVSLEIIKKVINYGYPVILFCDTYYIPWLNEFYKKVHSEHSILLIGNNQQGFYCNDTRPFLQKPVYKGFLNNIQMQKAFYGNCGFIYFDDKIISLSMVLDKLKKVEPKMFEQMEDFAEYIKKKTITIEDLENFDGNEGILLRAIRNIIRSRRNYILMLHSITDRYQIKFVDIIRYLEQSIEVWQLIKTLFYKEYLEKCYNRYHLRISELVYQCRYLEMKAYQCLNNVK